MLTATSSASEGIHAPFNAREGAISKVATKGKASNAGKLKLRRAKSAE